MMVIMIETFLGTRSDWYSSI